MKRHREESWKSPATSGMNRRQLSTGRSSVSSDGPRADTAAIIKGLSSRGEQMAEGRTKAPPLGPICADPLRSEKRTKSVSRSKRSEAMQPRQLHQTVLSTARTETRSASKGTRFIRGNAATRVGYRRCFIASKGADLVVLVHHGPDTPSGYYSDRSRKKSSRYQRCSCCSRTRVRRLKRRKAARLVFATDLEPHSLAAISELTKLRSTLHSTVAVIRAIAHASRLPGERNRLRAYQQRRDACRVSSHGAAG